MQRLVLVGQVVVFTGAAYVRTIHDELQHIVDVAGRGQH